MNRQEEDADERYTDYPSFDVVSQARSYDHPEVNYKRTGTEMLSDLHVFVIPRDTWKRQHKSPADQLITDALSAGYVRVNAQSTLSELREEISRQIGFRKIPRDFLYLRLIGRYFTQVNSQQEAEVKAKYFLPPQAYSPELYLIDADSVDEPQPTARPTDKHTNRTALPPIGASARSPDYGDAPNYNYDDDDDENDDDRRHQPNPAMSRADNDNDDGGWEEERDEIEEKKKLKMLEEEEELLRRKKMEDEERRRRKIAERIQTPSPPRRLTASERDAECMRILRKLEQLKNRRQDVEKKRDRMAKQAKALQQNYHQKRHDARAIWKKRYFDEKKKTVPKEELYTELRQKLLECHRKELAQLELAREAARDSVRRGETNPKVVEKANAVIHTTKLKNDIEDLSAVIQNTKMRLTSEMKLRNQSENELRQLKKDKGKSMNNWKDDPIHSTRPIKHNTSRNNHLEKYDPPSWIDPQTYRSEMKAPQPIFEVLTEPSQTHRPIDHSSDDDYDDDDDDKKIRSRDLLLAKRAPRTCHHCGRNRRSEDDHRHHKVKDRDLFAGDHGATPCRRCGGKSRKHPSGKRLGSLCSDCNKRRGQGRGRRGYSSSDDSDSDDRSGKPGHRGHHDDTSSDSDDSSSSCSDCHDSSSESERPRCGCKRGRKRRGKRDRRKKSQEPHGSNDHARRRRHTLTPSRNHKGHDPDYKADMNHHDRNFDNQSEESYHKSETKSTMTHDLKKDQGDDKYNHEPDRETLRPEPQETEPEKTTQKTTRTTSKSPKRPALSKAKNQAADNPRGRPYRPGDLDDAFKTFASKADGKEATNADVVKWCTDAEIFGKNLTSQHVDISFSKVKPKGSKTITKRELPALIDQMAVKYKDDKKTDIPQAKRQISEKLANASFLLHKTTNAVKAGAVARLTDTSKYTGMHKTRFNETGKGKGKDGQLNFDGYVSNYKMAGTYDDRH